MKFFNNINRNNIKFSVHAFLIAFSVSFFSIICNSDPSKKIKSENLKAAEQRSSEVSNASEISFDFDT